MTFHLTSVHIILVLFGLPSCHLLGIAAHSVDHMFSLYFDYSFDLVTNFSYFQFRF